MELTRDELDLCRQWFNSVFDVNPQYLGAPDFQLAAKLHGALGLRLANSVRDRLPVPEGAEPHPDAAKF